MVHAPGGVDVQHLDQARLARWVNTGDRVDHALRWEVALQVAGSNMPLRIEDYMVS